MPAPGFRRNGGSTSGLAREGRKTSGAGGGETATRCRKTVLLVFFLVGWFHTVFGCFWWYFPPGEYGKDQTVAGCFNIQCP